MDWRKMAFDELKFWTTFNSSFVEYVNLKISFEDFSANVIEQLENNIREDIKEAMIELESIQH